MEKPKKPIFRKMGMKIVALSLAMTMFTACGLLGGADGDGKNVTETKEVRIVRYDGPMSKVYPFVYTAKKKLSLTFNGMADSDTMGRLLDELDKYGIKATFFVPGMRVAEEPDIAKSIVSRGHEIENNTLNRLDMTKLSYEQIYKEIQLSNEIIKKETGISTKYVRTRSGDYTDDIRLAAAHAGMEAVVVYSLFLRNWQGENNIEKELYIRKYITRGGIITLDTEDNGELLKEIPVIAKAAMDVGYDFIPLSDLIAQGGVRKPLDQIEGYDVVKMNPDYQNAKYNLIYDAVTDEKMITLTFDDWGTDYTITKILDILAEHDVKATFFIRAKGLEANPNLARAMIEEGHEVANHSYDHPVVTNLTPEQLQEDVVKAYQVITEAIQQKPTMLFRPPTGEIDDKSAKIISATGYPDIALYDVTTFDWDKNISAEDIVNIIMEKTENGSVILLHMLDDTHTIEALPTVIERLKKKGYKFVKMAEMIGLKE
ncbi:polysaccharide deacetylase family protein [Cohnella herbarum]|uniref:Polysaccharide deacetylase family protein n=1 Tax=Cohnella herbarum TaxID=2728023 RepID=A0A7Z2VGB4_9BACL|nr:polysaccharide deacetylase family protein [Cohnella herbarum]QJD82349.1 polysaccharide deacetylase family protein [Cohnella herbarum]